MAMRKRTALTIRSNQENTKIVKPLTTGVPAQPTRRAALGEIANKLNVKAAPGGKTKVPPKPIARIVVDRVVEKVRAKPLKKERPVTPDKPSAKDEKAKETFSSDLLPVEDIDRNDGDNPALVSIYSSNVYDYLRHLEKEYPLFEGFLSGQEVTPKMRSVLVDWLVEVHEQFRLLQETLYLTVAIIDRYLQACRTTSRKRLQLVGVTAMFVACKYEEVYSPDAADFVYITDNTYTKAEILQMEMLIVKTLDYSFGRPLSLHFLRRYSKAGQALPVHHTMAKYFLEQSLVHYELSHYAPSLIAAAATYLSFLVIGPKGNPAGKVIWPSTLVHYSTYTKNDVLPVAREIASVVVNAERSKYQAVARKYSHAKHMKISRLPELKSPTILAIAGLSKN